MREYLSSVEDKLKAGGKLVENEAEELAMQGFKREETQITPNSL